MDILEIAQKHGNYRQISPTEYAGPCPKCGGAMRLRIFPLTNEFRCASCGIAGGLADIGTVFPVEFDLVQADALLRDLNNTIGGEYPTGAMEWLRTERMDIIASLHGMEQQVDAAYLAEDMAELAAKVDLLRRSYLKAFGLFLSRPPVIDVEQPTGGAECSAQSSFQLS